jgi:hydroxyacylglutathione hydrolase
MKVMQLTTGPVATNVWVLADVRTQEAIAIDTATPSVRWLTNVLADEGWDLRFIVSTHRHWDHIGDNAEAVIATGATLAVHQADHHGLLEPDAMSAPFPIPPSYPALELAEGSRIRFGDIDLLVLHTPGHTEGSVCLLSQEERVLLSGLATLDEGLTVLPGHGGQTTIGREKPWLQMVAQDQKLPF